MPPRYAYWTILVDDQPTAFRAGAQGRPDADLQSPEGKAPSATMMWFQNGKLWPSRLDAQEAMRARGEMGRRGDERKRRFSRSSFRSASSQARGPAEVQRALNGRPSPQARKPASPRDPTSSNGNRRASSHPRRNDPSDPNDPNDPNDPSGSRRVPSMAIASRIGSRKVPSIAIGSRRALSIGIASRIGSPRAPSIANASRIGSRRAPSIANANRIGSPRAPSIASPSGNPGPLAQTSSNGNRKPNPDLGHRSQ